MTHSTDLAKTSPKEIILTAELFAIHLGAFLLGKYAHLHRAYIDVQQLRWQRIDVDGKPHKHSFWRDGDEKRVTSVEVIKPVEKGESAKDNMVAKVVSGIKDLLGKSTLPLTRRVGAERLWDSPQVDWISL